MKNYPITNSALNWLEVILSERFGHKWILSRTTDGIIMKLDGNVNKIIFPNLSTTLIEAHSNQPYSLWDAEVEGWNSILGEPLPAPGFDILPSPLIEEQNSDFIVHYDILGLTYWMLARVEEIDRKDLDEHERFPATSSHAYKHGYLERPIVDEWMHILRQVIKKVWSEINLINHEFKMDVSCDIDRPFKYTGKTHAIIRGLLGDLIKRKSVILAFKNLIKQINIKMTGFQNDPYYKGIKLIMEYNELVNNKGTFFIMSENSDKKKDRILSLDDKNMQKILIEINSRGHEIGLHPGYNTFSNSLKFETSVKKLRKIISNLKINQLVDCGRQHYLRWRTPDTALLYENNDLKYDSTLGYADCPGFRCGTCFEYIMFNPLAQKIINIKERPLILMESSLIDERYLGFGTGPESFFKAHALKEKCRKVNGRFAILWHNSHFNKKDDEVFYKKIITT